MFKADVIIVPGSCGLPMRTRDDPFAVGQKRQPVHSAVMYSTNARLQRGLFQLRLVELLRVHRGLSVSVPDAEHLVALRQIVVRDGSGEPKSGNSSSKRLQWLRFLTAAFSRAVWKASTV